MNSPKSIRIQKTLDRESVEYRELFSNRGTLIRLSVGTKKENASPLNLGDLAELLRTKSGEFQELKELFLWNIQGLTSLSNFPKLSVLDIRNAPDLTQVTIPAQIERLILENCPSLTTILIDRGQEQPLDKLWELSLAGSSAMPEQAVHALLKKASRLRSLDVSNCTNLQNLGDALPLTVERLRARDCTSLETVRWPRRVGFADFYGCKSLNKLNLNCPQTLGYLDLTFCRSLTGLGSIQDVLHEQELKSLFLYGSGIMNPPFSEHGSQIGDNVAQNTREFFDELKKSGTGESKRCKLLLLGNGYAGKTELAHRVRGIPRTDFSSTHGIQLCTIDAYERHVTQNRSVQLNIWDFAGQDLYHSTHRLFVSTGSIFIIVWDPEADLSRADNPREGVTNFPIRYWLDYLNTIAPGFHPIRAIVCNNKQKGRDAHGTLDPEWCEAQKGKLKRQIGDEYFKELQDNKIGFFCVDLKGGTEEQLDELYRWIGSSISKVIDEQGTQIPLYWQYGHEMVRPWITNAPSRTMGLLEFQEKLQKDIPLRIQAAQADPKAIEDPQILSEHWKGGTFIDEKRTKRVLRYLTRTGYLYWDEKLHNEDIIIDQPWALDRVYKLLERTPEQGGQSVGTFQGALLKQNGCFDDSFLEKVVNDPVSALEEDQLQGLNKNLLLSFMISTGVCFPKRKYWQIGVKGQEYISPWHLPDSTAEVKKLLSTAFSSGKCSPDTIKDSAQLHAGHWHALMRLIAEKHGDEATFYKWAIYITGTDWSVDASKGQSQREWRALIEFEPVVYEPDGRVKANGRIIYRSVVPNEGVDARLKELIQSQLPGYFKNPSDAATAYEVQRARKKSRPTVFVSYAWGKDTSTGEYARIVDALEQALKNQPEIVTLVRDRNENKKGAQLTKFMEQIETCDYAIVVLSDKYLTSWYCMYELMRLYQSFESSSRFEKDVVFICHPSLPKPSGIPSGTTPYSKAQEKWSTCEQILKVYQTRPKARIRKADKDMCDVDLGINTVGGWHLFPTAYKHYINRLPEILQKLQLRIDLRYKNHRKGSLDPKSISEVVEKTVNQLKMLQNIQDA